MKHNTFKKYFLMISVLFLFCITFIVVILSIVMNNYLSKDKFKTLGISCDVVSNYASVDYQSGSYKRNIYNISRAIVSTESETVIIVADKDANAICCTCNDFEIDLSCNHTENKLPDDFIKKIDSERVNEITKIDGVFDDLSYVTAEQIKSGIDESCIGYVVIASKATTLTGFFSELAKIYAFSAIIPVIIMFFVLYIMTNRWNKPLKLMSEAAQAMAKGDFSRRIPVTDDDEIGSLAVSFNQMTNSLVELENMRRGFVQNVSHELKTPMTTIGGFIDGIIDGTIEPDKQEYYLKLVSNEVKRLSRLVQGMLNLSKLEGGETKLNPSQFEFNKLVLDILISQEQRIESRNLDIVGLDELEHITINADRDLIYQVIYNLCDNAIKFTQPSGTISFTLKHTDNMLDFRIRNTGKGIPEKDLPLVFERFYKGDKARSDVKDSTGLGLYLVKTIVKLHGGKAFVSSKENSYTEFGICLPL